MKKHLRLLSTICIITSTSVIAEPLNYNLYHISTIARTDVSNDIMKVTLLASSQSQDAAQANDKVNKQMASALKSLSKTDEIKYATTNYQTRPIYKDQQIVAWKTSQQLELTSKNMPSLTQEIGQLQNKLNITAIGFEISPFVRQETQNQLSVDALNQFKQQAELIQKNMGASDFQIVTVNINTGNQHASYPRTLMKSEMALSTPVVKGGTSTVNVEASGQIQLMFN
ncbi:SIMPL domain-containing protein [Shewanella surugensis]|uniref:SIMPL domain-containing protein n=1 Tax=Shewanella surugensis TaxID=212020 RepID=A0ABT0L8Z0_9GAMM|nr:SIMPL domain-containing protein [Shewanella surugensis]MCL1124100.1 SIMPL domain-containing protein [Shewanella surugensis]